MVLTGSGARRAHDYISPGANKRETNKTSKAASLFSPIP
jgi:hypothetical protein